MVAGESGEDGNALEELHSNLESLHDPRHLDLSDSFIATTSNYRPDDSRASSSGIAYLGQVGGGSDPGQIVVPMEDAKIKECASTITIHNLRSGKEVTRIEATPGLGGFNCISLAPDGPVICAGGAYDVMMFGLKGVGASVKIGSHTGRVSGLCFAQDGRTIASCSHDWTVQVWDLERGCRVKGGFRGHAGPVNSVTICRGDSDIVASGGTDDEGVILWDVRSGGSGSVASRALRGNILGGGISSVAISRDGLILAAAANSGYIGIWDLRAGKAVVAPTMAHQGGANSVTFAGGEAMLVASGGVDGSLAVWSGVSGVERYPQGKAEGRLRGAGGRVSCVCSSPDESILATLQAHQKGKYVEDGRNEADDEFLLSLGVSASDLAVAASSGARMRVNSKKGGVMMYDPFDLKELQGVSHEGMASRIVWSRGEWRSSSAAGLLWENSRWTRELERGMAGAVDVSARMGGAESLRSNEILTLKGITSVDVSLNTHLEYLPLHELVSLTSLTSLDCTGCPLLVSPPRRVADRGGAEVVSFLRRVADKGVFCCDSPLIITSCGSSSISGRESWHEEGVDDGFRRLFDALTSIESKKAVHKGGVKALSHARWGWQDAEKVQKDERVPGGVIRAAHWKPEGVRGWDKRLSFTVYQVGPGAGLARPLFYVGRATYVVAWKLRPGGGAVAHVIEEVDTIQACAPRAAVVLVATEAETVTHQEALGQVKEVREAVSKRLSEIKHSEATCIKVYDGGESIIVKREGERVGSSGDGADAVVDSGVLGVGAVAEAIVATAQSSPFYREAVPEEWVLLASLCVNLASNGRTSLDETEWAGVCAEAGVSKELRGAAMRFLSERGLIRAIGMQEWASAWETIRSGEGNNKNKGSENFGAVFLSMPILACIVSGLQWGGCRGMPALLAHLAKKIAAKKEDSSIFYQATRLLRTGVIHPRILPYIFPSDYGCAADYWQQGGGWPGWKDFPRCKGDQEMAKLAVALRSSGLLVQIGGPSSEGVCSVPSLLANVAFHMSGCFIRQELSPWTFKIALVSPLPQLMLSLIAVYMGMEGNERSDVWEHNQGMSCVYRRGHIMQLVLGADKAKGGGIIRCSASSEELFKAAKASIKRVMQSFFPGIQSYLMSSIGGHVSNNLIGNMMHKVKINKKMFDQKGEDVSRNVRDILQVLVVSCPGGDAAAGSRIKTMLDEADDKRMRIGYTADGGSIPDARVTLVVFDEAIQRCCSEWEVLNPILEIGYSPVMRRSVMSDVDMLKARAGMMGSGQGSGIRSRRGSFGALKIRRPSISFGPDVKGEGTPSDSPAGASSSVPQSMASSRLSLIGNMFEDDDDDVGTSAGTSVVRDSTSLATPQHGKAAPPRPALRRGSTKKLVEDAEWIEEWARVASNPKTQEENGAAGVSADSAQKGAGKEVPKGVMPNDVRDGVAHGEGNGMRTAATAVAGGGGGGEEGKGGSDGVRGSRQTGGAGHGTGGTHEKLHDEEEVVAMASLKPNPDRMADLKKAEVMEKGLECVRRIRDVGQKGRILLPVFLPSWKNEISGPRIFRGLYREELVVKIEASGADGEWQQGWENELLGTLSGLLDAWRLRTDSSTLANDKITIQCTKCVENGEVVPATFDSPQMLGALAKQQRDDGSCKCSRGHVCSPISLLSGMGAADAVLPCPKCLERDEIPPHVFPISMLRRLGVDDDDDSVLGFRCPMCADVGLDGITRSELYLPEVVWLHPEAESDAAQVLSTRLAWELAGKGCGVKLEFGDTSLPLPPLAPGATRIIVCALADGDMAFPDVLGSRGWTGVFLPVILPSALSDTDVFASDNSRTATPKLANTTGIGASTKLLSTMARRNSTTSVASASGDQSRQQVQVQGEGGGGGGGGGGRGGVNWGTVVRGVHALDLRGMYDSKASCFKEEAVICLFGRVLSTLHADDAAFLEPWGDIISSLRSQGTGGEADADHPKKEYRPLAGPGTSSQMGAGGKGKSSLVAASRLMSSGPTPSPTKTPATSSSSKSTPPPPTKAMGGSFSSRAHAASSIKEPPEGASRRESESRAHAKSSKSLARHGVASASEAAYSTTWIASAKPKQPDASTVSQKLNSATQSSSTGGRVATPDKMLFDSWGRELSSMTKLGTTKASQLLVLDSQSHRGGQRRPASVSPDKLQARQARYVSQSVSVARQGAQSLGATWSGARSMWRPASALVRGKKANGGQANSSLSRADVLRTHVELSGPRRRFALGVKEQSSDALAWAGWRPEKEAINNSIQAKSAPPAVVWGSGMGRFLGDSSL